MKNEMLADLAIIKSQASSLEAKILTLVEETLPEPEPETPIEPQPEPEPEPTPEPVPEPVPEPPPEPPAEPSVHGAMPMTVRAVSLSTEQMALLDRLERSVAYRPNGTREVNNLDGLSRSGRLNDMSRHLMLGMVPVFAVLRALGRRPQLERAYQVSQNLRGTMGLHFGFRGWVIYRPGQQSDGQITGIESIKANSLIAQLAWAFRQNEHVDAKFAAEADFWQTYLIRDFVGYWSKRTGRTAPPYVDADLFHTHADSIRVSHYLWKLTGDPKWLVERDRLLDVLGKELIPVGDRFLWCHFVNSLRSVPVFPIQHTNYSGETITSYADMGLEGVLDETTMQKLANTVTWMLDGGTPKFMKGNNGATGVYYSPLLQKNVQMNQMEYPREGEYTMRARGWGLMSYWDESSEIEGVCVMVDDLSAIQPIVGRLLAQS